MEGLFNPGKFVLAVGRFVVNTCAIQSLARCFAAGTADGSEAAEAGRS